MWQLTMREFCPQKLQCLKEEMLTSNEKLSSACIAVYKDCDITRTSEAAVDSPVSEPLPLRVIIVLFNGKPCN